MSVLDSLVGVFAYSIIIIPIAILIIISILYYYKPIHRFVVGIIAITLGSIGLVIYSMVLLVSIAESTVRIAMLSVVLVAVEIFTLYIGVKSLRNRGKPSIVNMH
jgi:hypothetical protein